MATRMQILEHVDFDGEDLGEEGEEDEEYTKGCVVEDIVGENESYDSSYYTEGYGESDFSNANKYHIPRLLTNFSEIGVVIADNSPTSQQYTFSH